MKIFILLSVAAIGITAVSALSTCGCASCQGIKLKEVDASEHNYGCKVKVFRKDCGCECARALPYRVEVPTETDIKLKSYGVDVFTLPEPKEVKKYIYNTKVIRPKEKGYETASYPIKVQKKKTYSQPKYIFNTKVETPIGTTHKYKNLATKLDRIILPCKECGRPCKQPKSHSEEIIEPELESKEECAGHLKTKKTVIPIDIDSEESIEVIEKVKVKPGIHKTVVKVEKGVESWEEPDETFIPDNKVFVKKYQPALKKEHKKVIVTKDESSGEDSYDKVIVKDPKYRTKYFEVSEDDYEVKKVVEEDDYDVKKVVVGGDKYYRPAQKVIPSKKWVASGEDSYDVKKVVVEEDSYDKYDEESDDSYEKKVVVEDDKYYRPARKIIPSKKYFEEDDKYYKPAKKVVYEGDSHEDSYDVKKVVVDEDKYYKPARKVINKKYEEASEEDDYEVKKYVEDDSEDTYEKKVVYDEDKYYHPAKKVIPSKKYVEDDYEGSYEKKVVSGEETYEEHFKKIIPKGKDIKYYKKNDAHYDPEDIYVDPVPGAKFKYTGDDHHDKKYFDSDDFPVEKEWIKTSKPHKRNAGQVVECSEVVLDETDYDKQKSEGCLVIPQNKEVIKVVKPRVEIDESKVIVDSKKF